MKKCYVLRYILPASIYFFATTNYLYPMEGEAQIVARYQRITQTYRYSIMNLLYSSSVYTASYALLSISHSFLDDDSKWKLVAVPIALCGLVGGFVLNINGFCKSREAYKLEENQEIQT